MSTRLLVLGGIRSGKSEWAAARAATAAARVGFVATGRGVDAEFAERIARHRAARPSDWLTIEGTDDLAAAVTSVPSTHLVLLDSLGTWVGGLVEHGGSIEAPFAKVAAALRARPAGWIVVSDEVGLAPVPLTEIGRRFVDGLGWANRQTAQLAEEVALIVAGRPLRLAP